MGWGARAVGGALLETECDSDAASWGAARVALEVESEVVPPAVEERVGLEVAEVAAASLEALEVVRSRIQHSRGKRRRRGTLYTSLSCAEYTTSRMVAAMAKAVRWEACLEVEHAGDKEATAARTATAAVPAATVVGVVEQAWRDWWRDSETPTSRVSLAHAGP